MDAVSNYYTKGNTRNTATVLLLEIPFSKPVSTLNKYHKKYLCIQKFTKPLNNIIYTWQYFFLFLLFNKKCK